MSREIFFVKNRIFSADIGGHMSKKEKRVDSLLSISYISTIEKALSHGAESSFECLVLSFEL